MKDFLEKIRKSFRNKIGFIKDTRKELNNVSWPSWREVRGTTIVVIISVFFFGFFVPIFRGDVKWTVIMFVASVLTVWLATLVFCFTYNGTYIRDLLAKGYYPTDDYSKNVLRAKRYIV